MGFLFFLFSVSRSPVFPGKHLAVVDVDLMKKLITWMLTVFHHYNGTTGACVLPQSYMMWGCVNVQTCTLWVNALPWKENLSLSLTCPKTGGRQMSNMVGSKFIESFVFSDPPLSQTVLTADQSLNSLCSHLLHLPHSLPHSVSLSIGLSPTLSVDMLMNRMERLLDWEFLSPPYEGVSRALTANKQ